MVKRTETVTEPDGSQVDTATGEVADVGQQLAAVPVVDWPAEPTRAFLLSVCRRQVQVRREDTEAMSRAIAERALGAETPEEVTRRTTPQGWESHFDVPFHVVGVHFGPSAYDEGCPVYAQADAVRVADGEPMMLSIGAWSPVYQLMEFHYRGWLPRTVALVATRSRTSQYDTYSLVDAG
jgi:hypothetical protein